MANGLAPPPLPSPSVLPLPPDFCRVDAVFESSILCQHLQKATAVLKAKQWLLLFNDAPFPVVLRRLKRARKKNGTILYGPLPFKWGK